MMKGRQSVCAVVVTYNRKELLGGCLEAICAQSYPVDRILVIDNASTDGTREFLQARSYDASGRIEHVLLPENGGGAAGFHEGFKRALATGADWIWAMDDDGVPEVHCLEHLLNVGGLAETAQFLGPLVLGREEIDDPATDLLAFHGGVEQDGELKLLQSRSDVERYAQAGVLRGYACTFNGVLIHRSVVQRIGLPDARFFIWGDEWDYLMRARELEITVTTVTPALYWHPVDRSKREQIKVAGLRYEVPCAADKARSYLLVRNYAYLAYRYRGVVAWIRHTIKYVLLHRTPAGCFSSWDVLRFSFEGMTGRFHGKGDFA